MRALLQFLLLPFGFAQAAWRGSPIISSQGLYDLFAATSSLIRDLLVYFHDRIVELILPKAVLEAYDSVISSVYEDAMQGAGIIMERLLPTYIILTQTADYVNNEIDACVGSAMSAFSVDFERRYPEQVGRIGASIWDKILCVVWLWLIWRLIRCTAKGSYYKLIKGGNDCGSCGTKWCCCHKKCC